MEPGGGFGRLAAMSVASVRAALVAAWLIVAFVAVSCGPAAEPSLIRSAWPVTMTGTTWTAIRVGNEATVVGSEPTAAFSADEFKGSTGCNSYFGSYQYANGVIKIGQIGSTAMACLDGAVGATEQRFMAAMQGASSVSIDPDGRLVLDGSGGSITFVVAPQPTG
jgi:heat shock protein HslJ